MTIKLYISDPLSRSYLRSTFSQNEQGYIEVSNTSLIGSVICSSCKQSDFRPEIEESDEVITFILPTSSKYTSSLINKYLRVTKEGERVINNAIRREFDTTLLCYCNTHISWGLKLNDAIYSFMSDYGLIEDANFETIKKRHYRIRLQVTNTLHEQLRKKYYELSKKYTKK